MMMKWIHFATILAHIILVNASHSKVKDFDDTGELDEQESAKPCIDVNCVPVSNKEESKLSVTTPKEKSNDRKEDELQQLNVFNLMKLLTLFAKIPDREQTKIFFNVRDIQSGFHNTGRKYHVGNIHRELRRDKRDTVSEFDEGTEISVAVTETSFDNPQSAVEEIKKIVTDSQTNNDDKTANINAEANSFQDSNVTDIYDSVANGTTRTSMNEDKDSIITIVNENSNGKVDNTTHSVSKNISQLSNVSNEFKENSETEMQRLSKQSDSVNATVENNFESHQNHSHPSKVKIPLSGKDLNKIHNVLSDDLGVSSEGAKSVANFSLTGLGPGEKNKVIVIVYNCSCGNKDNNHTHDNSTDVVHNDDANNDTVIFNTRRILSNDNLVISNAQTDDRPVNEVQNKTNNALLENELLQKCESLLSLQQKNNVNEASESKSGNLNEDIISSNQANTEYSSVHGHDDVSAKQTLIDNVDINEANVSQVALNKDVVDEAVSLANESVNAFTEASNSPTVEKAVEDAVTRKKRSVKNGINLLTTIVVPRKKRGIKDIVESFFNYVMTISNKTAEDSKEKSDLPKNESVVNETGNAKDIENDEESELLNSHRKKRSVKDVLEYVHNHYTPNDFLNHAKYSKDGAVRTKRDIKSTRNPKYYNYSNDKQNLLESDPNPGKYDGIIVSFIPINDRKQVLDTINTESLGNNTKYYNSTDFTNEDKPSHNGDISSDDRDLLNLLSFKPVNVYVYLQILMKNLGKDQQ